MNPDIAVLAVPLTVRFWLPLLVIFHLTVVAAGSSRADGLYLTDQIGVARVGGELGRYLGGGFAGHIGVGFHQDGWAVEGSVHLDEVAGRGLFAGGDMEMIGWGAGVRRLFPVSPWVRLYARGGLERVHIAQPAAGASPLAGGYAGGALDLGAGLVVSGRVRLVGFLFPPLFFTDIGPEVSAGAWLDAGDRLIWLRKERASDLDGFTRSLLVGVSIGGGF